MYEELETEGLQILAFPCNQFMSQEPGTNEEIKAYAQDKFKARFPLFSKIDVNGDETHEVYKYLRRNSELWNEDKQTMQQIPWNFSKFLVDSDGKVQGYFDTHVTMEETEPHVRKLLGV